MARESTIPDAGRPRWLSKWPPGRGKLIRPPLSDEEQAALGTDADALGDALDVFLNDGTYWACIPSAVWEYKIVGFQVLKKWLSYREHGGGHPECLGRGLTAAEARHFTALAQRLTAVVMMTTDLDAHYDDGTTGTRPLVTQPLVDEGTRGFPDQGSCSERQQSVGTPPNLLVKSVGSRA